MNLCLNQIKKTHFLLAFICHDLVATAVPPFPAPEPSLKASSLQHLDDSTYTELPNAIDKKIRKKNNLALFYILTVLASVDPANAGRRRPGGVAHAELVDQALAGVREQHRPGVLGLAEEKRTCSLGNCVLSEIFFLTS